MRITAKLLFVSALTLIGLGAANPSSELEFVRLDLLDGRKLNNVAVKTYDPKANRVLLAADGKLITVSLTDIPQPVANQIKATTRRAGGTVSTTAEPKQEVTRRVPVQPSEPTQPSASALAALEQEALLAHKGAATDRARKYFSREHVMGTANIKMDNFDLEVGQPVQIPLGGGRYRTEGTAQIFYHDEKDRTRLRKETTSKFEVVTEAKSKDEITVVSFALRS